ncbi:LapA family protein [Mumia zhuanghuii]|uniref:Lipopolysaccharide assembly protein A domain-containing protein n=1 Tax=Mumia zhuanghuii TaxID=2585211 RepID=A0A5C4MYS3_9ACTN|nr:LapA family protein [Mumia zhuanghuii]TNC49736.1 hypothetical protein FHE65_04935 [Mumia zhuanghuii]TNC49959.1 hypothetical protein FHE65_04520 [Mumia zhuanghuii]
MIALGVLLIAMAVLVGVVVSVEATESVSVAFLGWDITTDGVGAFWIGAASMLVAVLGLALILRGFRRSYRVRKENRQLRKEHRRMEQQRAEGAVPAGTSDEPSHSSAYEPTSGPTAGEHADPLPGALPSTEATDGTADPAYGSDPVEREQVDPHRPPPPAGT